MTTIMCSHSNPTIGEIWCRYIRITPHEPIHRLHIFNTTSEPTCVPDTWDNLYKNKCIPFSPTCPKCGARNIINHDGKNVFNVKCPYNHYYFDPILNISKLKNKENKDVCIREYTGENYYSEWDGASEWNS